MEIKSQSLSGRLAGNEANLRTPVLSATEWAALSGAERNAEMRGLSTALLMHTRLSLRIVIAM